MQRRRILAALALLAFATPGFAQTVPSSPRARAAEARVTAPLQQALRAQGLTLGAAVFLRITKQPAEVEAWVARPDGAFQKFKTYPICALSGGLGPKTKEGDLQAPEGFYAVAPQQMNPASQFHLSFNLGYPNAYDRHHGRTGSALMVHGNCVSIGCYAMTDPAIEEIWTLMSAAFRAGQSRVWVHAFPFRLTEADIARRKDESLAAWIAELKPAWDAFERTKRPPRVLVRNGRYVIG
jgi:murein L,D-transpeptidase YafK